MSKPFRNPEWFRFYATAWRTSEAVADMSMAQVGVYLTMLVMAWEGGTCSLPDDPVKIARMSGRADVSPDDVRDVKNACWVPHPEEPGRVINPKLWECHLEATERSRAAVEKAKKSHAPESRRSAVAVPQLCQSSADALPMQSHGTATALQQLCNSTATAELQHCEKEEEIEIEKEINPPTPQGGLRACADAGAREAGDVPKPKAKRAGEHEAFPAFWAAYPEGKRLNRKGAAKSYNAAVETSSPEAILEGLELWKRGKQWANDGGQYIPHPTTFLNQRRFETPPQAANSAANNYGSKPHVYRQAPLPPSEETVELPF
jgi:hypothetical protein